MRRAFFSLAIVSGAVAATPSQAGGFLQDLFSQSQRAPTIVYHYAPVQPQMRFIYDEGLRVSRRPSVAKRMAKDRPLAPAFGNRIAKKKVVARQKPKTRDRVAHAGLHPSATKATGSLQTALCCKHGEDPSQLIHNDTTLRIGDAYMTPHGLRIYRGRSAGAAQGAFIDYRKAEIGQAMKTRLSALEDQRARAARLAAIAAPKSAPGVATFKAVPTVVLHQAPAPLAATPSRAPAAASMARTSVDPIGRIIRVVGP